MDLLDVLNLIGGISLFLFGMNIMGNSLERKAGGRLKSLFNRITKNSFIGLAVGTVVTAIIQSSAATTIMVIGFINSGLMTLSQSVSVIMGANIGTTITSWILSLSEISGTNWIFILLKPTTFVPVLAFIGTLLLFRKDDNRRETGNILLGFSVLMFGMTTMSSAVVGLKDVKEFTDVLVLFSNPILGIIVGMAFTAVLQSSSASVGVLQALAATGRITYDNGVPIILGQNIGKCVISLISSFGANKNAKRAAFLHLFFNVFGAVVFLAVFLVMKHVFLLAFIAEPLSAVNIAIIHTLFNIVCTVLLFPVQKLLVRLSERIIPDDRKEDEVELDERLLITPAVALEQCRSVINTMAKTSVEAIKLSFTLLAEYDEDLVKPIIELEDKTDRYEDILSTYLIKFSSRKINSADSMKATEYLKCIGDFERMADHSINIARNAKEIAEKEIVFPETTKDDIRVLLRAVTDICEKTADTFLNEDIAKAYDIEPLEQVIDKLKEEIRIRHIKKMQQGICSMHEGFVLGDLLTNLERISDHCSNIAGCMIDSRENNLLLHTTLGAIKNTDEFKLKYDGFLSQYALAEIQS